MVRIFVIGDSGVGKTCIIARICHHRFITSSSSTIGYNQEVWNRDVVDEETGEKSIFEFIDVSGHAKFALSRSFLYRNIDGIIFVYDVSNKKSFANLENWAKEVLSSRENNGVHLNSPAVLFLGNKTDKLSPKKKESFRVNFTSELFNGSEILQAQGSALAPDSLTLDRRRELREAFENFFAKAVEKAQQRKNSKNIK
eukprot:g1319.t1